MMCSVLCGIGILSATTEIGYAPLSFGSTDVDDEIVLYFL